MTNNHKMRPPITDYRLPCTDSLFHLPKGFGRTCLSLILTLALLVACNQPEPPPTPTPAPAPANPDSAPAVVENPPTAPQPAEEPAPDLSGRIVLWHSWAEADGDALAALLSAFQAEHPNLAVDTLFVGYNDLPQSYADAVLSGGGPDLILAAGWWVDDMVAARIVQPLDELVAPPALASFWPATLEHFRRDGQLYALPTHFELVSLFANRALIGDAPAPSTTNDLLALAQQNPQRGSGLYASLYHLYWGLPAYGAQLFDAEGRVILDQQEGASQFLGWLIAMNQTPGVFVDSDYGMLLDRFKKGEFAFFVDGPWAIDDLRAALGENLSVLPLPAGPGGAGRPWLSADGVFLNPNSPPDQQRRALALARFLTSPAAGQTLAQVARRLPANLSAGVGDDPLLQGFMQQAAAAESMPGIPEMQNVWGYGGDMLIKALNRVGEPAEIVVETATLINEANGK